MKEEKFVLNSCTKLHTCDSLLQCVHKWSCMCVSVFMSRSTKAQGNRNVHLLDAALLLDFIKT